MSRFASSRSPIQANLRPEDQLLLYCARTTVDEEAASQVQVLTNQTMDWSYLVKNAVHHRVIPLLFRSLQRLCPNSVPKEVLTGLRGYCAGIGRRNLYLTAELLKLTELLQAKAVPAIPYKGPAGVFLAYGNVCLRQFNDLDILVRPNDYLKTRNLLLAEGFQLTADWGWECTLSDDRRGLHIDVHRDITPARFPVGLEASHLWERLKAVPVAGGRIRTLSAEDFLLVLCIQLIKDGWGQSPLRLGKLCDIAELLRSHSLMDWEYVRGESKSLGCQRMLNIGVCLAHEFLGAPEIKSFSYDQTQSYLKALEKHLLTKLFSSLNETYSETPSQERFYRLARERWRDRVYPDYYDLKSRFIPNDRDRAMLSLPESLDGFYYVVRPIRLMRDWALSGLATLKSKFLTWKP
jgi:hypothetical protein